MRDSGKQWLGVPVYIADGDSSEIQIATRSKENPVPMWIVSQKLFADIESNFPKERPNLMYLLGQFERGKLEPLNAAAEEEDRRSKEEEEELPTEN